MQDYQWGMQPEKAKAVMLAKRQLAEFVCDAVNLEGLNFTLPEIQTLLEGITVGGHRLSDQQVAVNQGNAWRKLFAWVESDQFQVTAEKACELHAVAGKEEALHWGRFRSGMVTIAGTDYMPPDAERLPSLFEEMCEQAFQMPDIYDQAILVFLAMARYQFFYDVNKRMGRFMMNGHLLSNGYPAINVPAKKQLTFNELMLRYYETADPAPMNRFIRDCMDDRVVRIIKETKKPGIP